jgi:uncharacterized protein with HEPN domain
VNDPKRLRDILTAVKAIEDYSVGSFDQLISEAKTQDAIMYNLIVIGEAANRISPQFQELHPEIPWASLIGTRNVIVHGYDEVKLQIVWEIIQRDLGELKSKVEQVLRGSSPPAE